ncbi:hypothetical protein ABH992_003252 [Bradyrhizobium yuanmingense]|uniref:Uncharacterized protein n=1 Tax=Bradyrhizobium yuanmingense TaxID=108015 RepID=A0ABV4GFY0_9BRAD
MASSAEFLRALPLSARDASKQCVYGWRIESRPTRAENRTRARHSDSGKQSLPWFRGNSYRGCPIPVVSRAASANAAATIVLLVLMMYPPQISLRDNVQIRGRSSKNHAALDCPRSRESEGPMPAASGRRRCTPSTMTLCARFSNWRPRIVKMNDKCRWERLGHKPEHGRAAAHHRRAANARGPVTTEQNS